LTGHFFFYKWVLGVRGVKNTGPEGSKRNLGRTKIGGSALLELYRSNQDAYVETIGVLLHA